MKGDDLFEKSSMTFGEHLDELRIALTKATICLALGLVVGIPMASRVVTYMQVPLERSLENFYNKRSLNEMSATSGGTVPDDLKQWMEQNKVVSQSVWVDPKRLAKIDTEDAELRANADSEGLPSPSQMLKMRMFVP
ncbi:MAG: hypothetical protein FJ308_23405, partial [Planctomycetes bacterium]|nr:hypothetical protein [Planctomycetota bacterium]